MTEPSTASADPTLDQLILAASKELVAAQMERPRNQARIDAARIELARLKALRDA